MSTTTQTVRRTLRAFFTPRSIAVVGAGRARGGIGAEIFNNLVSGFTGDVFAVNPHGHTIGGTDVEVAWAWFDGRRLDP